MKKFLMIGISVILLLSMVACKAPEGVQENVQAAFIWGLVDSEIFKESTASVPMQMKEYVDDTIEKVKHAEVFIDVFYDVEYQRTTEKNGTVRYVYQANIDGEELTLRYFGDTQKLAQYAQKGKGAATVMENLSTEKEFKDWISSTLIELGFKDFREGYPYTYSCETRVVTSGADFAGQRTVEGFYTAKDDTEKVSGYTFDYTRYLAGVPTSDKVSVYISKNTVIIDMDEKRFLDTEAPELDMTACDEAVEKFLNAKVDTKKYTLASYEAKDAYLTYIGEKLCLVYAVEMDLKDNVSGGTIATAQKVAVDVNAISK